MIKIVPDKEGRLTQWDKDRKVIVTGLEGGAEVHFAAPGDDHGAYVVELTGGEAAVPNILLTMAGVINVYVYPADRTAFAAAIPVMAREKPDDYIYTETEVLSYKTLDDKIGDLTKLTTAAKENLVAAINEAATKGTASVYMRVAEGYIEYSGDGVTWEKLIAVAELKGEKGDKGDTGAQGVPGVQGVQGEKGDKGDPGKDAAVDISLGITSAAAGDIVKVKAVDANGKPTEWEAADDGGSQPYKILYSQTLTEKAAVSVSMSAEAATCNEYIISVAAPKGDAQIAYTKYSVFFGYANIANNGVVVRDTYGRVTEIRGSKSTDGGIYFEYFGAETTNLTPGLDFTVRSNWANNIRIHSSKQQEAPNYLFQSVVELPAGTIILITGR